MNDGPASRGRAGNGPALDVGLRPWQVDDLDLLRGLLGDPAMMTHLGGPETEAQVRSRHERYLSYVAVVPTRVFAITVTPTRPADRIEDRPDANPLAVGWIGYWETDDPGEMAWEIGWSVLPAWQGQGIASRGAMLAIERAAAERRHRWIHAYPAITNAASNRVCERLGFELVTTAEVEYPKGHWMTCNDWRRALW